MRGRRAAGSRIAQAAYLALLLVVAVWAPATGAEFRRVTKSPGGERLACDLHLTGKIELGDTAKLSAALKDVFGNFTLCLDSKGGVLSEGMDMAVLLLDHAVRTRVLPGHECNSACAVLFMAGTERRTNLRYISRQLSFGSRLGFHAPEPPVIDGKVDTGQAYDAAIEQVGRQLLRLANQQHMSWGFPLIKASLLNRMLLTSYTKLFEIDDIGRAAEFGIVVLDAPVVEVNSISAVRNVCHNAMLETVGRAVAEGMSHYAIKSYQTGRVPDEPANPGRRLHTLTWQRKFSSCKVEVDADRDMGEFRTYRVELSFGSNTHPVVFAPTWYALSPYLSLKTSSETAPETASWCAAAAAKVRAVCALPEFAHYERQWRIIKANKQFGAGQAAAGTALDPAEETAWRGELAACGTDYRCLNNAYVEWLWKFNWGSDVRFFDVN